MSTVPIGDVIPPCPFCGGESYLDKTLRDGYEDCKFDRDAYAYSLNCNSCACEGPWKKSKAGALRAWAMRTPLRTKATTQQQRISYDDDGNLDDVVVGNVRMFRLEYMSDESIWIRCYRDVGEDVVINLAADGLIRGTHEIDPVADRNPEPGPSGIQIVMSSPSPEKKNNHD